MNTLIIDEHKECNNRQLWVDICRGIGIILVVIGHCHPPFEKLIYGFHMPLFFILTGYLCKKRNSVDIWNSIRKDIKRYIVPYFILCLINLLRLPIPEMGFAP